MMGETMPELEADNPQEVRDALDAAFLKAIADRFAISEDLLFAADRAVGDDCRMVETKK